MFCSQCGQKNPGNSKFCQGCGNRLQGAERPSVEPPPPQAGTAPPSVGPVTAVTGVGAQAATSSLNQVSTAAFAGASELTCPNCHKKVAADKSFCTYCGTPLSSAPARVPRRDILLVGVGVFIRGIAAVLDSIVFMIIGGFITGVVGTASFSGFDLSDASFYLLMLIGLAYYVVFEGTIGATPGKLLLGLRVVQTDGRKCDMPSSLIRNLLRIIDVLPFFYLVGMVLIWTSERKQRLGDRLANTMVVRRGGGGGKGDSEV